MPKTHKIGFTETVTVMCRSGTYSCPVVSMNEHSKNPDQRFSVRSIVQTFSF